MFPEACMLEYLYLPVCTQCGYGVSLHMWAPRVVWLRLCVELSDL